MADHFGSRLAFFVLMGIGFAAVLMAYLMPETRPSRDENRDARATREAAQLSAAAQDDGAPASGGAPPTDAARNPSTRRRA